EWPSFVRSSPGALPVVVIDGFDELLQTTGVRQTDYLLRVPDFQRRERERGRPMAAVVTTRTSVADRARVPAGTILLRLEPFDRPRRRTGLDSGPGVTRAALGAAGTTPLDADIVLAQFDLASHPLRLLMLALSDADGNALRRLGLGLRQNELYEQLLLSFARR